jgi:hypothetical protein
LGKVKVAVWALGSSSTFAVVPSDRTARSIWSSSALTMTLRVSPWTLTEMRSEPLKVLAAASGVTVIS